MFYLKMYPLASAIPRLFLAALPDAAAAARIYRLAAILKRAHGFSGKLIAPDRLHVSLFFLGGLPHKMVRAACETLADTHVPPFDVLFDRTACFRGRQGSRPFVLIGGEGLSPLRSFRRELGAGLARRGWRRFANTNFEPHVTLLYDARDVEEYPLGEPISWKVSEIVLVRSMKGHEHLAKWQLSA
jgi:2'-5' RNA ligase